MAKFNINLGAIFDGTNGICKECGWEILNCPHLDICYKCRERLNPEGNKNIACDSPTPVERLGG